MKNTRTSVQYPFATPALISSDDLGVMSDPELHESSRILHSELNDLYKRNRDRVKKYPTHLWETELAYVQRELSTRAKRRALHAEWELREQEIAEQELYAEYQRDEAAPPFRGNPGFYEFLGQELTQ